AHFLPLDLASLASVRGFARDFRALGLPLHLLVNNVGVMLTPPL
ncbi:dehydrogenase/reductase (SDR family) X chromosome, isoform CRA_b, partial [Mus musculus]